MRVRERWRRPGEECLVGLKGGAYVLLEGKKHIAQVLGGSYLRLVDAQQKEKAARNQLHFPPFPGPALQIAEEGHHGWEGEDKEGFIEFARADILERFEHIV